MLEPGGDPDSGPAHAAEVHGRGVQGLGVVGREGAVEHQGLAHRHVGIRRGDLCNTKVTGQRSQVNVNRTGQGNLCNTKTGQCQLVHKVEVFQILENYQIWAYGHMKQSCGYL